MYNSLLRNIHKYFNPCLDDRSLILKWLYIASGPSNQFVLAKSTLASYGIPLRYRRQTSIGEKKKKRRDSIFQKKMFLFWFFILTVAFNYFLHENRKKEWSGRYKACGPFSCINWLMNYIALAKNFHLTLPGLIFLQFKIIF